MISPFQDLPSLGENKQPIGNRMRLISLLPCTKLEVARPCFSKHKRKKNIARITLYKAYALIMYPLIKQCYLCLLLFTIPVTNISLCF